MRDISPAYTNVHHPTCQTSNSCTALTRFLVDNTIVLASGASGMSTFYNCTSIVDGYETTYSSSTTSYAPMVVD